jgi:hypothetical protein
MYIENARIKLILAVLVLPLLLFGSQAFCQSSASLSGTVQDASQGVVPGAAVTAVNNDTGIKSTTTANNAGVYNFPSLPPATYKVTVAMPGFQTTTKTDVNLNAGMHARLNFELPVAGVSTQIEISTSVQDMVLESGSSTGSVFQDKTVTDLPLMNNDLLDLVNQMGGVVKPEDTVFGNSNQTFAGVPGSQVNVQRDGVTVNEVRYMSGISAASRLNPEMVGEFKVVLSSVDAEYGRGGGQVQVVTKSGANGFHGSGVWDVQNTALDANEWSYNKIGRSKDWRNLNEYTITANGPIKKNKSFFFAMWNQAIPRTRATARANVLTPCARKGIFRYFSGWLNGASYLTTASAAGTSSATRPVVNADGTPRYDVAIAGADAGKLQYYSVLGKLTSASQALIAADPVNCSQYLPQGLSLTGDNGLNGSWDTNRNQFDQSGYMQRFMAKMPMPNEYIQGDGLNVGDYRWLRTSKGQDNLYGTGQDNARKQLTVKLDHNLTAANRLSGSLMLERDVSTDGLAPWPGGYSGVQARYPVQISATLTSTLGPTLLNEFRFGFARTESHSTSALDSPGTGADALAVVNELMPTKGFANYDGFPLLVNAGNSTFAFNPATSHPVGGTSYFAGTWGGNDPRVSFADSVTWTRGAHSIKGGFEIRISHSNQDSNGDQLGTLTYPVLQGGNATNAPASGIGTNWTGLLGNDTGTSASGSYASAYAMMNLMAGSISSVKQYYFVNSATQKAWNDPTKGELTRRTNLREREFSIFFKDDWKVNSNFTLNLGVRYDYYGTPWVDSGMTAGWDGGPLTVFAGTNGLSNWMSANPAYDTSNTSLIAKNIFVGPNSPNPDKSVLNKDMNNIGPAVGFAWQIPWFGKGKTTLRGGYQLSYMVVTTLHDNSEFGYSIMKTPGLENNFTANVGVQTSFKYTNLANAANLVPNRQFQDQTILPLTSRPYYERSAMIRAFDQNTRTPYIQSMNLSLTRNIGSSLTLDVRYIGTLTRKSINAINLNTTNFINNGLAAALAIARTGGESDLLNQMIKPNTLQANTVSGAAQLRANGSTSTNLATGNFNAIAGYLATTTGNTAVVTGTGNGRMLRYNGIAENFIYTSPQFASVYWSSNMQGSNYHSMQAQATMRPKRGLSFNLTYTWSRNLGLNAITDYRNYGLDYGLMSNNRQHAVSAQGTYVLPFGANGFLLRDSNKTIRKIVEGWQLSWIGTYTTGVPYSVGQARSSMWGGAGLDLVRPDLFNTKGGQVTWADGADTGRYFGDKFVKVSDPQCATIATGLQALCNGAAGLRALALASDPSVIVIQHAKPGTRGNMALNQLTGPGRWNLDTAMGKTYEFMEGKSITLRVDALNIFNHPTPSGAFVASYNSRTFSASSPVTTLAATDANPFGYVGSKVGHRVFSAKIRLNF